MSSSLSLVFGSTNSNKTSQIREVCSEVGVKVFSLTEIKSISKLSDYPQVIEDGRTYFENALIKASAFSSWCGRSVLSDDSGLEVDALEAEPGLNSQRFGGESFKTDLDRVSLLLSKLKDKSDKKPFRAFYKSALVLKTKSGAIYSSEAEIEGVICERPRGSNGFGYDPVFEVREVGKTFSEFSKEDLMKYGFRIKALRELLKDLDKFRSEL